MDYNVYVISANRYNDLPFNKKQKADYIFCVKKVICINKMDAKMFMILAT